MPSDKTLSSSEAWSQGMRLLREAMPSRWRLYALLVICMLGVAGFTGALAYSTKLIVNDIFVAADTQAAYSVAAFVIFVAIGKSFFEYANAVLSVLFNRSIAADYQKKIFRSSLTKDVWYYQGKHTAASMAELKLLGQASGTTMVTMTNKMPIDILTLLALLGVMLAQDPVMTLVSSILFPVIFLIVGSLSKRVRAAAAAETELAGAYFAVGAETFAGIKTVKSYQLESKSIDNFENGVEALEARLMGIARVTSATVPLMELLGGLVLGIFVMYAGYQTIENGKTPGEFTAFITAFLMAYQPAQRVSKSWVTVQKSLVQVGRMFKRFDAPVTQRDDGTQDMSTAVPAVAFNAVSFSYKEDTKALDQVSFKAAPGERIAIVGRSGAGKSTLIDLMLRFYDPTDGQITVADTDLRDFTENSVRQHMALISQDVFLFDGTIEDNIRDGNPDASSEDIATAIRQAQLEPDIAALPNGIKTRVGPNGNALSGGQRQRVGIARALAKKAKIYIFDEATSALDVENERRIMEMLQTELQDSTVLFVTHRATTLPFLDRILVLESGKVAGFDTHEILSDTNERYRALFKLA